MPNYRKTWDSLASRAVKQSTIDAETFLKRAEAAGMSPKQVSQRLIADLENDGPIFGKFTRSLAGAASSSVLAAERQGVMAGTIQGDEELSRLLDLADVEDAIEEADPDELEDLEKAAGTDDEEFMWVCTLKNTCHECLPLHGKILTMGEWKERGLLPELMHDGWKSDCQCHLVPATSAKDRKDLIDPLVRNKIPGGKRTTKGVLQADVDRARSAVAKANASEAGRRVLRALGSINEEDE